jgi:mycothiol synthase
VKVRRPTNDDPRAVAALVRAFEAHFTGLPEMSEADLRHEWHELELDRDVWLIELGGELAGYAALYTKPHTYVDAYVHPDQFGRGVGARLVDLSEAEARHRGIELIRYGVLDADERAQELLASRGYREVRRFYRMLIELDGPPEPPEWPDGLELAPFDPTEARAFHAALDDAFADHWDHRPESFEDWSERWLEAPDSDVSLWCSVKDADEIAAVLTVDRERYGVGWVGLLGVRPPWRRRGLGIALLRHAFAELYARGQPRIGLGVDAQNPTGATRLYERAGMHVAWAAVLMEKRLAV